jgi:outer membrane receptor protein involved in Fe transport
MSSPFSPSQPLPLDATILWPAVVQIMRGAGVDLSAIPAPTIADVSTSLRILDLSAGAFRAFTGSVDDVEPLKPTITNSFEAGYRTMVADRMLIDASVYSTRRQNFIAPLALVTPNVFLSTQSLAAYLGRFMPAAQAGALAAGIGGVDGNAAAPGIPLATVGPTGKIGGSDLLLTYRNVGDVKLWGTDLSMELAANDRVSLSAAYSWVSRNYFAAKSPSGLDVSTNAPRNKVLVGVKYHSSTDDFSAELRGRHVGGFRMVDGVLIGDVDAFTVADAEVSVAVPSAASARFTFTVQNIANERHAEFFAHPVLGRLAMARLTYRF